MTRDPQPIPANVSLLENAPADAAALTSAPQKTSAGDSPSDGDSPLDSAASPAAQQPSLQPRPHHAPRLLIRRARGCDLPEIAAIHGRSLPDEFLAKLGRPFLARAFYPTLLEVNHAETIVAIRDTQVAGFLTTRIGLSGALTDVLKRHPFRAVRHALSGLARRPGLLRKLPGILVQLHNRSKQPPNCIAELFLMAVHPAHRRTGVGRSLIEHSAERLAARGIADYLVWLHADNTSADAAYNACGFELLDRRQFAGTRWTCRRRKLTGQLTAACPADPPKPTHREVPAS